MPSIRKFERGILEQDGDALVEFAGSYERESCTREIEFAGSQGSLRVGSRLPAAAAWTSYEPVPVKEITNNTRPISCLMSNDTCFLSVNKGFMKQRIKQLSRLRKA